MKRPPPTTSTSESADLRDDERTAESKPGFAHDRPPLRLDCLIRLDSCAAERRHRAEDKRGCDRYGRRKYQHPPVRREIEVDGLRLRRQLLDEQTATPLGEEQTEECPRHRQQQAFRDQLTCDSGVRRAERETDTELVTSGRCAGKEQICDVRARDQEDHADDRHDREQWLSVSRAREAGPFAAGRALKGSARYRRKSWGRQSVGIVASRSWGWAPRSAPVA